MAYCPIHNTNMAICMDCIPPVRTGMLAAAERRAQQPVQYIEPYRAPDSGVRLTMVPQTSGATAGLPGMRYSSQGGGGGGGRNDVAAAAMFAAITYAAVQREQQRAEDYRHKLLDMQRARTTTFTEEVGAGLVRTYTVAPTLEELDDEVQAELRRERDLKRRQRAEARRQRVETFPYWALLPVLLILAIAINL